MLSTISMTYISCKSRDMYNNIIIRPSIENATSARASGSFGSKYFLHKLILSEKCWDPLNAGCEVLIIMCP